MYPLPRYRSMVLALVGDSTKTRVFFSVLPLLVRLVVLFLEAAFFTIAISAALAPFLPVLLLWVTATKCPPLFSHTATAVH